MAQELIYTSAPRGLFPGSSGFCTVAMTDGLPRPAVEMLESLSNYYRPAPAGLAPAGGLAAVSYVRAKAGGQAVRVLSRNCEAPPDYTGRTNNLAHHLIPDADDQQRADNPAALAQQPGLFVTHWDGLVKMTPPKPLPPAPGPGPDARTWRTVAGDPGWALAVAETWIAGDGPLHLIFDPGTDLLPLLAEAIEQLPPGRRVDATFTTYYTGLPMGVGCLVRGVLAGTEQEGAARKGRHLVLRELRGRPAPVTARPPALAAAGPVVVPNGYGVIPADEPDDPFGPADAPPPPPGKKSTAVAPPPTSPRVGRNEYAEPLPARPGKSKALLAGLVASMAVNAGLGAMYVLSAGETVQVADAAAKQRAAEEEAKKAADAQKKAEDDRDAAKKLAADEKEKASKANTAKMNADNRASTAEGDADRVNRQVNELRMQVVSLEKERDAAKAAEQEAKRQLAKKQDKKVNADKPGLDVISFHSGRLVFDSGASKIKEGDIETVKDVKKVKSTKVSIFFSAQPPVPAAAMESFAFHRVDGQGVPQGVESLEKYKVNKQVTGNVLEVYLTLPGDYTGEGKKDDANRECKKILQDFSMQLKRKLPGVNTPKIPPESQAEFDKAKFIYQFDFTGK